MRYPFIAHFGRDLFHSHLDFSFQLPFSSLSLTISGAMPNSSRGNIPSCASEHTGVTRDNKVLFKTACYRPKGVRHLAVPHVLLLDVPPIQLMNGVEYDYNNVPKTAE